MEPDYQKEKEEFQQVLCALFTGETLQTIRGILQRHLISTVSEYTSLGEEGWSQLPLLLVTSLNRHLQLGRFASSTPAPPPQNPPFSPSPPVFCVGYPSVPVACQNLRGHRICACDVDRTLRSDRLDPIFSKLATPRRYPNLGYMRSNYKELQLFSDVFLVSLNNEQVVREAHDFLSAHGVPIVCSFCLPSDGHKEFERLFDYVEGQSGLNFCIVDDDPNVWTYHDSQGRARAPPVLLHNPTQHPENWCASQEFGHRTMSPLRSPVRP